MKIAEKFMAYNSDFFWLSPPLRPPPPGARGLTFKPGAMRNCPSITKGLAEGETVVTEGQLRIAPGLKVSPRAPGGGGRKGGEGQKKSEL